MNTLNSIKNTTNLNGLAKILGYKPKSLSYLLYALPPSEKYRTFTIPKKSGGTRTIQAPTAKLARLQGKLAEKLHECVTEIQGKQKKFWSASYGFQKDKTIVSNASAHRHRRFVFNADIENFFGSIHFGRVRGFFIHDNSFKLDPAVATIIAQIACHNNVLPQGSPCSPIISNLIGNILDRRLIALARNVHCTYTRYADDLTFSTNKKHFPSEIAINQSDNVWDVGEELRCEIENTGFKLNKEKTRMSYKNSRQTVTGLVVNVKPNIKQDYYRKARAMCNSLFKTGKYCCQIDNKPVMTSNLNPLEGILSHIYFVKARKDRKPDVNKKASKAGEFSLPSAPLELYRRFLFFKHFVALDLPLIVTEGRSDITYLKCAFRALAKDLPSFSILDQGKLKRRVMFLRTSSTTREVLNLGNGTGGQMNLINQYSKNIKRYGYRALKHPVIVLCDNDRGAKGVFKAAKEKSQFSEISYQTAENFYFLGENLYLVKIPEGEHGKQRMIEDLFPKNILDIEINGKKFNPKEDTNDDKSYGKIIFADRVVRANCNAISFCDFTPLLDRISLCLADYKKKCIENNQ